MSRSSKSSSTAKGKMYKSAESDNRRTSASSLTSRNSSTNAYSAYPYYGVAENNTFVPFAKDFDTNSPIGPPYPETLGVEHTASGPAQGCAQDLRYRESPGSLGHVEVCRRSHRPRVVEPTQHATQRGPRKDVGMGEHTINDQQTPRAWGQHKAPNATTGSYFSERRDMGSESFPQLNAWFREATEEGPYHSIAGMPQADRDGLGTHGNKGRKDM